MEDGRQAQRPVIKLGTLEYMPLSEKVASQLRNQIIENHLPADTKITESDLSTTLGVSRTVVREAIMMLVNEGLIVKAHNRYTKVASYTKRDIQEIYDMRGALELTAARICINKETVAEELLEKEQQMLMLATKAEIDRLAFVYADMDFHSCIVKSSENSRLMDAWSKILGPCLVLLYRYTLNCSKRSPLGNLYYDHSKIIRAFAAHDYESVYTALMDHIDVMKNILINEY
ncbi:MAG: GntR family transcriptional regulator [Lutisporaceae bacterium]|jgi:DNA-binding GntR family transcriptional regulator